MPVKIFCVEGNERIGGLESEIKKWQKSLGSKASVTHTSTAMTEHLDLREVIDNFVLVTFRFCCKSDVSPLTRPA